MRRSTAPGRASACRASRIRAPCAATTAASSRGQRRADERTVFERARRRTWRRILRPQPYGHDDLAGNVWECAGRRLRPVRLSPSWCTASEGRPGTCDEIMSRHRTSYERPANKASPARIRSRASAAEEYPGRRLLTTGRRLRSTNRIHHPPRFKLRMMAPAARKTCGEAGQPRMRQLPTKLLRRARRRSGRYDEPGRQLRFTTIVFWRNTRPERERFVAIHPVNGATRVRATCLRDLLRNLTTVRRDNNRARACRGGRSDASRSPCAAAASSAG